ncbi:hypothetical protein [Acinetobacter sp. CFCC 10889]|uniref:hypothetical protein n=1 Tax=Acinetobacter sp. CFCC 10889 TaxID=1775557 RepID=UPI000DD0E849|nr:hypothetical protein [Acinetobacter sp. CFCC 10889]
MHFKSLNSIVCILSFSLMSTSSWANTEISSKLKNTLQCKYYDQMDNEFSTTAYHLHENQQKFQALKQENKESYPLSTEFRNKFSLQQNKKSAYTEPYYQFVPKSSSAFKMVKISVSEGYSATLLTLQNGNIDQIADDFYHSKDAKMLKLDEASLKKLIIQARNQTNLAQSPLLFTVFSLQHALTQKQDNKTLYAKKTFIAHPKSQPLDINGALTVIYTDPLNENRVYTQCNLEL